VAAPEYVECKGGKCDQPLKCNEAGRCLYRSSADEAREVMKQKADRALADTPPEWRPMDLKLPKEAIYTGQDKNPLPEIVALTEVVRTFATGANRDIDNGKLDYEGFFSPTVMRRFAEYMHRNRFLRDGSMRDSDNWQKGIPLQVYMKSMMRHFMTCWLDHRQGGYAQEEELCALMFNVMGYLHQRLKGVEE
jgi:hypothetical protein